MKTMTITPAPHGKINYAVTENGETICHGGPVTRDVAIHNCLTMGVALPDIIPTNLSVNGIASALTAAGYQTANGDIRSSRFTGTWCQSGAIYAITFLGEEGEVEEGQVYVTERGGKIVAEY